MYDDCMGDLKATVFKVFFRFIISIVCKSFFRNRKSLVLVVHKRYRRITQQFIVIEIQKKNNRIQLYCWVYWKNNSNTKYNKRKFRSVAIRHWCAITTPIRPFIRTFKMELKLKSESEFGRYNLMQHLARKSLNCTLVFE